MKSPRIRSTLIAVCSSTLLLAACKPAAAVDPAARDAVEMREQGFKEIGKNFKKINDRLKGGGSLDDELAASAQVIAERAKQVPTWFPAGSGPESGAKTEAKPEIWSNAAGFKQKADDFAAAAGQLAQLAADKDSAGFAAQVKTVGGTCKGCHENFRAEKK